MLRRRSARWDDSSQWVQGDGQFIPGLLPDNTTLSREEQALHAGSLQINGPVDGKGISGADGPLSETLNPED